MFRWIVKSLDILLNSLFKIAVIFLLVWILQDIDMIGSFLNNYNIENQSSDSQLNQETHDDDSYSSYQSDIHEKLPIETSDYEITYEIDT